MNITKEEIETEIRKLQEALGAMQNMLLSGHTERLLELLSVPEAGDRSEPTEDTGEELKQQAAPPSHARSDPTLITAIDEYVEERTKEKAWGKKHTEAVGCALAGLTDIQPDWVLLKWLNREALIEHRNRLTKAGITDTTVNQKLTHIIAFFRWAHKEKGYLKEDITYRVKLKAKAKKRVALTEEEYRKILNQIHRDARTDAQKFIPWICMAMGLRREEAAQLKPKDFKTHKGVSYIDLEAAAEDGRGVKTKASARKVPIPSSLHFELCNFVNRRLEHDGEDAYLFDIPARKDGKMGAAVGEWANARFKNHAGKRAVLHCTRHTIATQLMQKGTPEYLISQLLGHENSNITSGVYGGVVDLAVLKGLLDNLWSESSTS